MTPLRRWWTKKYQKSPNSDEYKGYTLFDLLTEFFEDYYDNNPSKMKDLDLPFTTTGDPIVDKWEKEIEKGLVPDIMEDVPIEIAERLRKFSGKLYRERFKSGEIISKEEFEMLQGMESGDTIFRDKY